MLDTMATNRSSPAIAIRLCVLKIDKINAMPGSPDLATSENNETVET
jgi:hypothetical protein